LARQLSTRDPDYSKLGTGVKHRTNRYLNNRIEQDHRGIKGRYGPMRGFKSPDSASRFCHGFDELRNHLYHVHATTKTFLLIVVGNVFFSVASSRSV
jgi:transposase-like protein